MGFDHVLLDGVGEHDHLISADLGELFGVCADVFGWNHDHAGEFIFLGG